MVLMTMKEAAREQLRGFIADGELSYINVGRGKKLPRLRFDDKDIAEFKERRRRRAASHAQQIASIPGRSPDRSSGRSTTRSEPIGFLARRRKRLSERQRNSPTNGANKS
jgi:hypothetical protein